MKQRRLAGALNAWRAAAILIVHRRRAVGLLGGRAGVQAAGGSGQARRERREAREQRAITARPTGHSRGSSVPPARWRVQAPAGQAAVTAKLPPLFLQALCDSHSVRPPPSAPDEPSAQPVWQPRRLGTASARRAEPRPPGRATATAARAAALAGLPGLPGRLGGVRPALPQRNCSSQPQLPVVAELTFIRSHFTAVVPPPPPPSLRPSQLSRA